MSIKQLILTNQKKSGKIKQIKIIFDKTKKNIIEYLDEEVRRIEVREFLDIHGKDFEHILFKVQPLKKKNGIYCYQYQTLEELANVINIIYTTFIFYYPDCTNIHISPHVNFFKPLKRKIVPFSVARNNLKKSKALKLEGFISLISRLKNQKKFLYAELPKIDIKIDINDMPFKWEPVPELSKEIKDKILNPQEPFEIRYISDGIGVGIFSSRKIKKDELVGIYIGEYKIQNQLGHYEYTFASDSNFCPFSCDSMNYGNLTRFINHAPEKIDLNSQPVEFDRHLSSKLLLANIEARNYRLGHLSLIGMHALREIKPGEQLLFDYQGSYWARRKPCFFTEKQKVVDAYGNVAKKVNFISNKSWYQLAKYGVQDSQTQWILGLGKRFIYILLILFFILYFLAN